MVTALSLPVAAGAAPALKVNPPVPLPANLERLAGEAYASGARATGGSGGTGGRVAVRQLYGFEDGQDGQPYQPLLGAADVDLVTVLDNGVTEGKQCLRMTAKAGEPYGNFELGKEALAKWGDYDYFGFDLYTEDDHPYTFFFELWDNQSKNYPTRCTYEYMTTRPGPQTLLWAINRAKRNNKEGRDWEELQPQDKINLNALTHIKLFVTPRKDRNAVFWIDHIRLMQEDAAKPKLRVELPAATTAAFDFGTPGAVVPGFAHVGPATAWTEAAGFGFVAPKGLAAGGAGWPDLLTGTFIVAPNGGEMTFQAKVPNGEYLAWLAAGPIYDPDQANRRFLLQVNELVLDQAEPSLAEYETEKYLYRFLWTQYSERPHAQWLDYLSRMYPAHELKVKVIAGQVTVRTCNYFLGALLLLPAAQEADFQRLAARLCRARMEAYEKSVYTPEHQRPQPGKDDGEYLLYVPNATSDRWPWSGPADDAERGRRQLQAAAAPGQHVFFRVAVVPFRDLGPAELVLADLKGPAGVIPAASIRGHFVNYRAQGRYWGEMILLPTLALRAEAGVTQTFWLWLTVPADAAPGKYTATFAFRPTTGKATDLPVELEVQPLRLAEHLPAALGMYYAGRQHPRLPDVEYQAAVLAQFKWMRQLGFTSLTVPGGASLAGVNAGAGTVSLRFDPTYWRLAREAGLGATPQQPLLGNQLGLARGIARRLPAISGAVVDQQPGIELRQPQFKALWFNAMQQYKKFLDETGAPYVVEIVDEPREVPNPWNRNLADTCTYADWVHEVGLRGFVTPMGDGSSGKDYTSLAEHADIISIHAYAGSRKMKEATRAKGKTLWMYNCGLGRYMWGFYPWAQGVSGRFEWHWSWAEGAAAGGYPGNEWYNPFTAMSGTAANASPATYPGGFLYQSAYLKAAEGITDWRYLYSLEQALARHRQAGTQAAAVKQAEDLLAGIKAALPDQPEDPGTGAAVARLDEWRAAVARALLTLAPAP